MTARLYVAAEQSQLRSLVERLRIPTRRATVLWLRMQAQRPGGLRDRQALAVTAVMDPGEGLVVDHAVRHQRRCPCCGRENILAQP
jgi:hypothetical protein